VDYLFDLAAKRFGTHPWAKIVRKLTVNEREALGGGDDRELAIRLSARFGGRTPKKGPDRATIRAVIRCSCTDDESKTDGAAQAAGLAKALRLYQAIHGPGARLDDTDGTGGDEAGTSHGEPPDDPQGRLNEMAEQISRMQAEIDQLKLENAGLREAARPSPRPREPRSNPPSAHNSGAQPQLVRPYALQPSRTPTPPGTPLPTRPAVPPPPRSPNSPPVAFRGVVPLRIVPTSPPLGGPPPPPRPRRPETSGITTPSTDMGVRSTARKRVAVLVGAPAQVDPPLVPLRWVGPPAPRQAEIDPKTRHILDLQEELLRPPAKSRRPSKRMIEAWCNDAWADLPPDRWESDEYLLANVRLLGLVLAMAVLVYGPLIVAVILQQR